MTIKYLDDDGNGHTVNAISVTFYDNEYEITDEEGQVIYCDNCSLLEILDVNMLNMPGV